MPTFEDMDLDNLIVSKLCNYCPHKEQCEREHCKEFNEERRKV